jgi:type VI secretion system protein ImpA
MPINAEELLQPIPGADPGGADISFDDVVDRMREARRADDPNLSQGDWQTEIKVADPRLVTELASAVLTGRSKHLQTAVWLGEAAIMRDGPAGAAQALRLLEGLLDRYWDGMYPRVEGEDLDERASKLAWFNSYGSQALKRLSLVPGTPPLSLNDWVASRELDNLARKDAAAYEAAVGAGQLTGPAFDKRMLDAPGAHLTQLLASLDDAAKAFAAFKGQVERRFGRSGPGLVELEDALKKLQQVVAKAAKVPGLAAGEPALPAAPEAASGAAAFSASVLNGSMGLSLQTAPQPSRENALRILGEVAQFFRRTEPHSPVAYLLTRAIAWADMPLDQWLSLVVRDDSVLAAIRDRVGIDA